MAFTTYRQHAYRAWAASHPLTTGPWEAWYEIHTLDEQTMLSGPTKVPGEFTTGEAASAAAKVAAEREILQGNIGKIAP